MLPVEAVQVIRAENLQNGQFALLHTMGNVPSLILQKGDYLLAVFLNGDLEKCNVVRVEELPGCATVIGDWEIEVDHSSLEKLELMDNPVGSLAIKKDTLSIIAKPPSSFGYMDVPIRTMESENTWEAYAYRFWRIIRRVGDHEVLLFEKRS